jgi:uncharacterized protein
MHMTHTPNWAIAAILTLASTNALAQTNPTNAGNTPTTAAAAAPRATDAAVEELLLSIDNDSVLRNMVASMSRVTESVLRAVLDQTQGLSPAQRTAVLRSLGEYRAKCMPTIQRTMDPARLRAAVRSLYQTELSAQQVADITAFYKTDAGKAWLRAFPVLQDKQVNLMSQRFENLLPELEVLAREHIKQVGAATTP